MPPKVGTPNRVFKQALTLAVAFAVSVAPWAALAAPEGVIPVVPKPDAPQVFAGSNAKTKAAWQTRYTLGPNDVVSFAFYGRPELARPDVLIGPDGRVGYMQAQGIMASSLTIDELREAVTAELAKFYRRPRIIVTPVEFRSKKFYVLGKVVNTNCAKSIVTLDRGLKRL